MVRRETQTEPLSGWLVYRDVNGGTRWSKNICEIWGGVGLKGAALCYNGVLLCGSIPQTVGPGTSDSNFCAARYDNTGKQRWREFLGTPAAFGYANEIIEDKDHVIVVGQHSDASPRHIAVVCFQR